MSNSWFEFRQFRIEQEHCAMKVSTDACIQGAWTPVRSDMDRILDIGTGTGLLSLMLAQRVPHATIDALEIDANAARQAAGNFSASPWNDRLCLRHTDARNFHTEDRYDLIICNPPFFTNSLLGPKDDRNRARHTLDFSLDDLLAIAARLLAAGGKLSVLLPWTEHQDWESLVKKHGWCLNQTLQVIPKPGSAPNRVVSLCGPDGSLSLEEDLLIRDRTGSYTPEFINLLRPFYLKI
ncbi:MAG: methyltransferase domain-containing protein [Sphingobacteriales bacterium]|nr:MAG: methyltransferase domain-containing protein [Sphingobacteriales bacterium]